MVTEYAQLLSSVHHMTGTHNSACYKLTHKNHPCAVWVRSSRENYEFLLELAKKLGKEYSKRYGRTHKSSLVIDNLPTPSLPSKMFYDPPKVVSDDLKDDPDVVNAYRNFYMKDKRHFCFWKYTRKPGWFK